MSRPTLPRLAAASLLLLAIAACSDDDGVAAPSAVDNAAINQDVAAATGANIAGDIVAYAADESAVSAGFAGAGAPGAGTCTRSGNTVTCTGARDGNLTITRTATFFDAAGATQADYDAATTARIDIAAQVTGSYEGPQYRATLQRIRSVSITGLAGAETQRTRNGTGTATVQSTFTGTNVTRTHRMDVADTTANLVWAVNPRGQYPLSGTVTRNAVVRTTITGDRSGSFTATRRVQVTFNGTAQVPLVVQAVTRRGTTIEATCQLDLSTRTVSCNAAA